MEKAKYLMIGNSTAAVGGIEGIRSVDQTGQIVVLTTEPHHTYSRPLISYLLEGRTDRERMKYRPSDFYEKNGVQLHVAEATALDAAAKVVTCADGTQYGYEKLLVAAGSRPIVPRFSGLDTVEKRFTFMSLDDAAALEAALTADARVLIVGAGLIGLKCAEGIAGRCGSITVVDMAERVLPSVLTAEAAAPVQAHLERELGLRFILGDSVSGFAGNVATLASGGTVEFDILVVAVGVAPNVELVKAAGGEVGRGIITAPTSATTLADVWAAGDCAESFDLAAGKSRVLALLPNAYQQGHTAGVNMAGGAASFDCAIPMNAVGFAGLHIITAGVTTEEARITADGGNYKALFTGDGLLKGFILVGDVARAGIYTRLIREQVKLDTINFDMIAERPQLMAFAAADREAMLNRGQ